MLTGRNIQQNPTQNGRPSWLAEVREDRNEKETNTEQPRCSFDGKKAKKKRRKQVNGSNNSKYKHGK